MLNASCEAYQADLMALHDGELDAGEDARVLQHIETCPACRRDFEWIQKTAPELEAIADALAQWAPTVDLVDAVMAEVAKASADGNLIPFAPPATRNRPTAAFWARVAVAAGLLMVTGLAWWYLADGAPRLRPSITHGPLTQGTPQPDPGAPSAPGSFDKFAPSQNLLDNAANSLEERRIALAPKSQHFEETDRPDLAKLTVDSVLDTRRQALSDDTAWSRLVQMASLSRELALDVAHKANVDPGAIVGAAEVLNGYEAGQVLLTAVGRFKSDPSVHLAVANAFREEPDPVVQAEAASEVAAVQNLDPSNALPYYLEALANLERGDVAAALDALGLAQQLDSASAYALQAAGFREDALVAAGMDRAAAQLVSGLTAGMDQYSSLTDLAQGLLEKGQQLWDSGNTAAAQEVFKGVQALGRQIVSGALFSQEELAGLDIQRAGVEMLGLFYTSTNSPEAIDQLVIETTGIVDSLEQLDDLLQTLDRIFSTDVQGDFWTVFAGLLLNKGDLAALSSLQQWPSSSYDASTLVTLLQQAAN